MGDWIDVRDIGYVWDDGRIVRVRCVSRNHTWRTWDGASERFRTNGRGHVRETPQRCAARRLEWASYRLLRGHMTDDEFSDYVNQVVDALRAATAEYSLTPTTGATP